MQPFFSKYVQLQVGLNYERCASFAMDCSRNALRLLMDPEARVRTAVGECLGAAAVNAGPDVWRLAEQPIMQVIKYCWVSNPGSNIYICKLNLCLNPCLPCRSPGAMI